MDEEQAWQTLRGRYNGYWWGHGGKVYNPWAISENEDDGRDDPVP